MYERRINPEAELRSQYVNKFLNIFLVEMFGSLPASAEVGRTNLHFEYHVANNTECSVYARSDFSDRMFKTTTYQKRVEMKTHFSYTINTVRLEVTIVQVEIKVDTSCDETKVIIITEKMTDEISTLVKKISEQTPSVLAGFRDDVVSILDYGKMVRFYAANQRVYAVTENGEYTIRLRLYELEERLNPSEFVRISNSEIINLKKVQGFDLSFSGTICVNFQDGSVSYVSRRYVAKIKQVLGF